MAFALATRAIAGYCLGRSGWREDIDRAFAMARSADPMSYATVIAIIYSAGIPLGVLMANDRAVRESEAALRIAERSGDDLALANARLALGVALVHRQTATERDRGEKLLAMYLRQEHNLAEIPIANVLLARERVRRGDRDDAIPLMRAATNHLFRGHLLWWGVPATAVLVETLLDRGADGDIAEAGAAIERLAAARSDDDFVLRDLLLLRLRALLARARGGTAAYADLGDRYRAMAKMLDFERHIAWAVAMP